MQDGEELMDPISGVVTPKEMQMQPKSDSEKSEPFYSQEKH